jgi:hypothetical protein
MEEWPEYMPVSDCIGCLMSETAEYKFRLRDGVLQMSARGVRREDATTGRIDIELSR